MQKSVRDVLKKNMELKIYIATSFLNAASQRASDAQPSWRRFQRRLGSTMTGISRGTGRITRSRLPSRREPCRGFSISEEFAMLLLVRNLLNGVISEAAGRSRCARMAAGLSEKKEKVRGEKRRKWGKKDGGRGKKKRKNMLD